MRGFSIFAGAVRGSSRMVSAACSSSNYVGIQQGSEAMCLLSLKSSSSSCVDLNMQIRSYSSSMVLNKRAVKWDKTIKKWDITGKGFDEFVESKEKETDVTMTGRSWTPADLRRKSFNDLHGLWFVLYKERNLLLSEREKIKRMNRPMPPIEETRYIKVKRSMGAIKFVLNERSKIKRKLEYENAIEQLAHEISGKEGINPAVRKLADTKPGGISK
jgi:hypothetical protein